tara:strand:+ start:208 stop:369 length:162 start_codon:yes stop_codon:yes gene_type:complete
MDMMRLSVVPCNIANDSPNPDPTPTMNLEVIADTGIVIKASTIYMLLDGTSYR